MPAIPIIDALKAVRFAVMAALDPLTTSAIYWKQAEGATLPYVVFQSQDGGGNANPRLDNYGWQGLVTVKAYASNQGAAETLMAAVAPGMNSLTYSGYAFTAVYVRPIDLPLEPGVFNSCHQWRVFVEAA